MNQPITPPPKRLVTHGELVAANHLPGFEFIPADSRPEPRAKPPPPPPPDVEERAQLLLELVVLTKALVDPTTTLYEEALAKDSLRRILRRLG